MDERDPATSLEREADELEHQLGKLDSHISEAQKAADARREDLDPEVGSPTPGDADGDDD